MALSEYQRKRNFQKTSEPKAVVSKNSKGRRFVVQKHDASRLHYDFRLELDGVLKSWAVPKGPSLDPSTKSLAVEVEDHPVDYASFEGVIPEGEYGGGTVLVWDEGEWEPEKDPHEGLRKGDLKFTLHGKKLSGSWALVGMRKEGEKKNWLLIKHSDAAAIRGDAHGITERETASVVTGRDLDEVAADADRVWKTNRPAKGRSPKAASTAARPKEFDPSDLTGARKSPFPKKLSAQLATLSDAVPVGDDWLHEIKFDGYRMLAWIEKGDVRLVTRKGNDWTTKFKGLVSAIEKLPVTNAVLDGEIVALDDEGRTNFQQLQNAIKNGLAEELVYYLFDAPYLEGFDLRGSPLVERKQAVAALIGSAKTANNGTIRYSDHIQGNGSTVFDQACESSIEGIVSKRPESKYEEQRSRAWLKTKCHSRQEFVIGGFTKPEGSRTGFGALLLGFYDGDDLQYVGRVGTGFTQETLTDMVRRLKAIKADKQPFAGELSTAERKGVTWVRPELVAEVRYGNRTDDGLLRHSSFEGLREDKPPKEVVLEKPLAGRDRKVEEPVTTRTKSRSKGKAKSSARRTVKASGEIEVEGVRLTNPDRVLYPAAHLTKRDVADYYVEIAEWILPYVTDRPLTLVRCPQGHGGQSFYQKHWTDALPEAIGKVPIPEDDRTEDYMVIKDLPGLISTVQISALELHPWSSRTDRLENPDQVIFDLDPGPGVEWKGVIQAAIDVRDVLGELGLTSFVRTSGGKGLHVVAPLARRNDWDEVKQFAEHIALSLAVHASDRYVANMRKSLRKGRVFVDYLRNQRGATAVASYSTRNQAEASVAMPIDWSELSKTRAADQFDVKNASSRLRRLSADPWEDFFTTKQSLTKKIAETAADLAGAELAQ